jgi:hypothetical protein
VISPYVFLSSPVDRRHMGLINLTVGYGESVIQKHGDHLIKANKDALIATTEALAQFWFVDVFPFCKCCLCYQKQCNLRQILVEYVPSWFPGAQFQRIANANRKRADDIRYLGYRAAQEAYVSHSKSFSILSSSCKRFDLCRRMVTETKV